MGWIGLVGREEKLPVTVTVQNNLKEQEDYWRGEVLKDCSLSEEPFIEDC